MRHKYEQRAKRQQDEASKAQQQAAAAEVGDVVNDDKARGKKDSGQQETQSYFQRFKQRWKKAVGKPKFVFEVLALIGLTFYTCETHRTNDLTQTSLNLVKDQQRPYVITSFGMVGKKTLAPNTQADFNVILYNVGDSLATNIRPSEPQIRVGAEKVREELKNCPISYPDTSIKEMLPPHQNTKNGEFFTLPTFSTPVLDQAQYDRLIAYDAPSHTYTGDSIYIWGGVKYSGLRGGDYSTEYCFIYYPSGNPVGQCSYCRPMQ